MGTECTRWTRVRDPYMETVAVLAMPRWDPWSAQKRREDIGAPYSSGLVADDEGGRSKIAGKMPYVHQVRKGPAEAGDRSYHSHKPRLLGGCDDRPGRAKQPSRQSKK